MDIVTCGHAPLEVTLEVETLRSGDLWVGLFGGELSHVGGVVLGMPSPRVSGEGFTCDISQICAPSHKDVHAAAVVAAILVEATGRTVSVTGGIHVDDASREEIGHLMENVEACAREWVRSHHA